MKTLFSLVVTIGLAAALFTENAYQPNWEYVYDYNVQILSGLPEASKTTAGLVINCKVRIFSTENNQLILKMENIRLLHLVKELAVTPTLDTYVPHSEFVAVPDEQFAAMQRELCKPVTFIWQNGLVSNIQVEIEDPEWSVNIKKSILQAKHLDLKKETLQQLSPNDVMSPDMSAQSNVFKTKEKLFFGACEPLYSITESPYTSSGTYFNVTKIVDVAKCKREVIRKNFFNPERCEECDEDFQRDLISSLVEYNYGLIGSPEQFIVDYVLMKSAHGYHQNQPAQYATFIRAMLTLREKEPKVAARYEQLPRMKQAPEGLRMIFPEVSKEPAKTAPRLQPGMISEIKEILEYLISPNIVQEKKPEMILELINILQHASIEDIEAVIRATIIPANLHERQLSAPQYHLKRVLFMEILPFVNTKESVTVLLNLIATYGRPDCILSTYEIAEVFTYVAIATKPSTSAIQAIKDSCKITTISTNPTTKKACWLAYAAQLKRRLLSDRPINDLQFNNTQIETITRVLLSARTEEEQLIAVKLLAVPLQEFIPKIQAIITDTKRPKVVRIEAVKALEVHAKIARNKVIAVCIPILLNKDADTEIRVTAFRTIMLCKPKMAVLQLIAVWLSKERNTHVSSYCYSYLESISHTKIPCLRKWAKMVRAVVRSMEPIEAGMQYSKAWFKSLYSEHLLRQGISVETSYITTPRSLIPKDARFKASGYMYGRKVNFLEVSAYTQGLQDLVEKIAGPRGSWKQSDSVFDLVRRQRRDVSDYTAEQEKAKWSEKMESRRIAPQTPKIALFAKVYGTEIPFVDIDQQSLQYMMEDGRIRMSDIGTTLRQGVPLDIKRNLVLERAEYIMPTVVGIPLKMKLDAAASIDVMGRLKLEVHPGLFRLERNNQVPDEVKAHLTAKPKIAVYSKLAMDLEMPCLKIGTKTVFKVVSSAPINIAIKAVPKESKITVEYIPTAETDLIKIETIPKMRVKFFPQPIYHLTTLKQNILDAKRPAQPIAGVAVPVEKEISLPCSTFGVQVNAKVAFVQTKYSSKPVWPLNGASKLLIKLNQCTNQPEKYQVFAQCQTITPTSPAADNDWQHDWQQSSTNKMYHKLALAVRALKDGQSKNLVEAKLYLQCSKEPITVQTDFVVKVANLDSADHMKMCVKSALRLPQLPEFFVNPLPANQLQTTKSVKIGFGEFCNNNQPAITATMIAQKSPEQSSSEMNHHQWPEYKTCMHLPEHLRQYSPECEMLMEALAETHKLKIELIADRSKVPNAMREALKSCRYVLEHPMLNSYVNALEPIPTRVVINAVKVHDGVHRGAIPLETKAFDLEIITEPEHYATNLYVKLPMSVPSWSPRTFYPTKFLRHVTDRKLPAEVELIGDELTTFDGHKMNVQLTKCETVLVKDCSKDSGFAITLAKSEAVQEKKVVKFIVGSWVVKMAPAAYTDGAPLININGVRYDIIDGQVIELPEGMAAGEKELVIKKLGAGYIGIKAPLEGISIKTNFVDVKAKVSLFHFGKLCGLAGNYDGIAHNDQMMPATKSYPNYAELFRSYTINESQCASPETEVVEQPRRSIFDW